MEPHRIRALQARQSDIHRRWEALLRDEPAPSALAHPDLLVRLFDTTLGELFARLQPHPRSRQLPPSDAYSGIRAGCACGRNPLVIYFLTGEQALLETQASLETADSPRSLTALTELHGAIRQIARREVDVFCRLCRYRTRGGGSLSAPPSRQRQGRREGPRHPMTAPTEAAIESRT